MHRIAHLKHPFDSSRAPVATTWARDHDRDAILYFMGGGSPEMPQFFTFMWQGEEIELSGREEIRYLSESEGGTQVYRTLYPYPVPVSLQSRKDELLNLIREAFIANTYVGKGLEKVVHVQFSKLNKGEACSGTGSSAAISPTATGLPGNTSCVSCPALPW